MSGNAVLPRKALFDLRVGVTWFDEGDAVEAAKIPGQIIGRERWREHALRRASRVT